MEDEKKHYEVCELLKIWFYIKQKGISWDGAQRALEERINLIMDKSK